MPRCDQRIQRQRAGQELIQRLLAITRHQQTNLLSEINAEGVTVVVVTHETDIAARTQRVIHLVDGEIAKA